MNKGILHAVGAHPDLKKVVLVFRALNVPCRVTEVHHQIGSICRFERGKFRSEIVRCHYVVGCEANYSLIWRDFGLEPIQKSQIMDNRGSSE